MRNPFPPKSGPPKSGPPKSGPHKSGSAKSGSQKPGSPRFGSKFGSKVPLHREKRAEKPVPASLMGDRPKALAHTPDPLNDLIYGIHAAAAALANPQRRIVKMWATENGYQRLKEDGVNTSASPEIVHPRILDHLLTGQDAVHQGVVLEAVPLKQPRLDQVSRDGLIVLLDQVTDPHNVGAILRSCAAFDVKALVTTARHAPNESGVFFKAASGAYEHVPVTRVTNLSAAMEELRGYGFKLVGLDSEAPITLEQAERAKPLALVLGAEGKGLREKTRATCDTVARLDMPGAIKSLNVSIAAAISLYALTH